MRLEVARQKLAVLANAKQSVELGPVGIAGVISDACQAYRDLAADSAVLTALRSEIETLARTGSGARRIYAALLLGQVDRQAGTAELASLADSTEACDLALGGCTVMSATVGDAARHLLGRPS